jgi:hypothetical protein
MKLRMIFFIILIIILLSFFIFILEPFQYQHLTVWPPKGKGWGMNNDEEMNLMINFELGLFINTSSFINHHPHSLVAPNCNSTKKPGHPWTC